MGKIGASPVVTKDDDEGREDLPAFEKDGDEEEPVITNEGQPVVAADADDEDGDGEEKPKFVFNTQEELDAYIAKNKPAATVTPPTPPVTPTPPKDEEDEDLKALDNLTLWKGAKDAEGKWVGETPADWNDFARTVMKEVVKQFSPKAYAPKIVEQIKNMTAAERKEYEQINAEFDNEYKELATKGLVPSLDTKEGQEINKQISVLGGQLGLDSMQKAYDVWANRPKEKGGGLDYKPIKKANPSKDVSRLIGTSSQTTLANKGKTKMSYAKLHSARSVDDLIDE